MNCSEKHKRKLKSSCGMPYMHHNIKYVGLNMQIRACLFTWPFLEITQRESPAFATTSWFSLMIPTQAVQPEVGPEKSECGPCTNL